MQILRLIIRRKKIKNCTDLIKGITRQIITHINTDNKADNQMDNYIDSYADN